MSIRVRTALLVPIVLAVVASGAEGGAPLESSRQELRKLQGGQKNTDGPSAKEGLRPSLPSLVTPGQESLPSPELLSPEKLEKERKLQQEKEARKNWLVNGVQQLEKTDKAKEGLSQPETPLPASSAPKAEEGRDPQYLLKLYDEQKKIETERQGDTKMPRSAPADPLAPFLQGWLGNSPVRGQFFDEFARKPDSAPVGAAPLVGPSVPSGGPAATPAPGFNAADKTPAAPAPNPYLTDLNPMRNSQPAPSFAAPGTFNPAASSPVFSPPVVVAPAPPAEVRQPERKAPPPPSADDRKYFPQLNRF